MSSPLEQAACQPTPIDPAFFNPLARLPYQLTIDHCRTAMAEFTDFLGFVNQQLFSRGLPRLESLMMPATFSGLVGEFVMGAIPKHCPGLVRNAFHNGRPDLIPPSTFPGDAVLNGDQGIEVKGSRRDSGWQGHNAEDGWLMVIVFDGNRPGDPARGIDPRPFRFRRVLLAELQKSDWTFSGRKGASRRTITASVTPGGRAKLMANWVYHDPN